MPPLRENCESCGRIEMVCPECKENKVSIDCIHTGDHPPGETSLSPEFDRYGMYSEEDDVLKYRTYCWQCGWEEKRTLSVEIE